MLKLVLIIIGIALLPSCSVHKAVNQPSKKNLSVLQVGTPREKVIAELGVPIHTEGPNHAKIDVFSFIQGYSKANKTSRAALHSMATLMTAGAWEIIGTPIESISNGTEIKTRVNYNTAQNVKEVKILAGGNKVASEINR